MRVLLIALLLFFAANARSQSLLKIIYSSSAVTIGGVETEHGAGMDQSVRIRMLMQPGVKFDSIVIMDELYVFEIDSFPAFSAKDTLELIFNTVWSSDSAEKKKAHLYIWKRDEKLARGPWPARSSGTVNRTEEFVSVLYYTYKKKSYPYIIRKFNHAIHLAAP